MPYRAAAFLGSFLAFTLELIAAKLLLPRYGGSAAVWTTCLVFFQAALLAALVYGQAVLSRVSPPRYARWHLALLAAPALFPVTLPTASSGAVSLQVLWAVARAVGVPFFILSTTTLTLQSRLMLSAQGSAGNPYRLYAASNAGAFTALLAYPLLIEPLWDLGIQLRAWYALYILYAVFTWHCLTAPGAPAGAASEAAPEPLELHRARWTALAAGPCLALVATTNYLAFNIAGVPLLWAAPLALYLLTYVVSFADRPPQPGGIFKALAALAGLLLSPSLVPLVTKGPLPPLFRQSAFLAGIGLNLLALLGLCLLCHGLLAESRPRRAEAMPQFYIYAALGGLLGSALPCLLLPVLARHVATLRLDWAAACAACAGAVLWYGGSKLAAAWRQARAIERGLVLAAAALCAWQLAPAKARKGVIPLFALRNFYGIYAVDQIQSEGKPLRRLFHGNTIHGMQYRGSELRYFGLTYYHPNSPLGIFFDLLGASFGRIGAVGLGAGSIAAYGEPGQEIDFFELDADVEAIARRHFTFLKESLAKTRVILGDARLSLENMDATYDVLILDAFSSDAIPVHLLTKEAFELYFRRLTPEGIILCHVSNRMLTLRLVLASAAVELGLSGVGKNTYPKDLRRAELPSEWIALSRDPQRLAPLRDSGGWSDLQKMAGRRLPRVWTDQYASLLPIIGR